MVGVGVRERKQNVPCHTYHDSKVDKGGRNVQVQCDGLQQRPVARDDNVSGKQEKHAQSRCQHTQYDGHGDVHPSVIIINHHNNNNG